MKNLDTILILVGILSASILVVENMVLAQQAFVYIFVKKTWVLAIACIITGFVLGYGTRGKLSEKGNVEEDSFDF